MMIRPLAASHSPCVCEPLSKSGHNCSPPSTLLRKLSGWRKVEMEQKWSKSKTGRLQVLGFLERETGIEPATNSLEGCDSTMELLPPVSLILTASGRGQRPPMGSP